MIRDCAMRTIHNQPSKPELNNCASVVDRPTPPSQTIAAKIPHTQTDIVSTLVVSKFAVRAFLKLHGRRMELPSGSSATNNNFAGRKLARSVGKQKKMMEADFRTISGIC